MRAIRTKKGVSPLIAAVLLVAFTMAIAAMLTAWVTQFTTEKEEESRAFQQKIECSGANIVASADFVVWNATSTEFETRVKNIGVGDVTVSRFQVWYENKRLPVYLNLEPVVIESGGIELIVLNVTDTDTGYLDPDDAGEPVKVMYDTNCEGVWSTLSRPMGGWNTQR